MTKFLALTVALLLFAACSTPEPVLTTVRHRVVMPEESMFQCETVQSFPESRTLTDLQVARLLVELHQNNVRCRNSLESVKAFLERAQQETESPSPAESSDGPPRRRSVR